VYWKGKLWKKGQITKCRIRSAVKRMIPWKDFDTSHASNHNPVQYRHSHQWTGKRYMTEVVGRVWKYPTRKRKAFFECDTKLRGVIDLHLKIENCNKCSLHVHWMSLNGSWSWHIYIFKCVYDKILCRLQQNCKSNFQWDNFKT